MLSNIENVSKRPIIKLSTIPIKSPGTIPEILFAKVLPVWGPSLLKTHRCSIESSKYMAVKTNTNTTVKYRIEKSGK
jgi:hypothetical protein